MHTFKNASAFKGRLMKWVLCTPGLCVIFSFLALTQQEEVSYPLALGVGADLALQERV